MMDFKKFMMLSLACCLTLSGCSPDASTVESNSGILLPVPSEEPENMILGEQIHRDPESVMLYYVSGDGTSFSTINRTLTESAERTICEEAIHDLLYNTPLPDRLSFVPDEMQILSVNTACGIASVNLSLEAQAIQNEQDYLTLVASITNTLLSVDGVRGVNVQIDGKGKSIANLPIGVQTQPYAGITPAFAQFNAEHDYFLEAETGTIERTAILFYPSETGHWLIPELRTIEFDSSDYASALIRSLTETSQEHNCTSVIIPEGADLLVNNPIMEITASGERVLRLDFASMLHNFLALTGMDEWKFYGSIVMTLTSFIPDLDAVKIYLGDDPVTQTTVGNQKVTFKEGLLRRSCFTDYIGSTLRLHVPKTDGTVEAVEQPVSMERAQSPLNLLCEELRIIPSGDQEHPGLMEHISSEDILGILVEDEIASVNFSGNFYRQAQMLDTESERSVVYAIVNTLCQLDNIQGVHFLIEGIPVETLSGSIYLRGILLPNPGIVEISAASPAATATP